MRIADTPNKYNTLLLKPSSCPHAAKGMGIGKEDPCNGVTVYYAMGLCASLLLLLLLFGMDVKWRSACHYRAEEDRGLNLDCHVVWLFLMTVGDMEVP